MSVAPPRSLAPLRRNRRSDHDRNCARWQSPSSKNSSRKTRQHHKVAEGVCHRFGACIWQTLTRTNRRSEKPLDSCASFCSTVFDDKGCSLAKGIGRHTRETSAKSNASTDISSQIADKSTYDQRTAEEKHRRSHLWHRLKKRSHASRRSSAQDIWMQEMMVSSSALKETKH